MGEVYEKPLEQGFHVVNPFANFYTYDCKKRTFIWDNLGVPSQDKFKTTMDVAVTGSFIPGTCCNIRNHVGNAQRFLSEQVRPRINAAIVKNGQKCATNAQDFYKDQTLSQLESNIIADVNKELIPLGYSIVSVKFSDINLPPVIVRAVEQTKERTEQVNRQQAQLEIAKKKAQERVQVAEANARAAKQNKIAEQQNAEARAYAIRQEASAKAEGIREIRESITPAYIEYLKAQAKLRWDGKMPKTMIGGNATPIMDIR